MGNKEVKPLIESSSDSVLLQEIDGHDGEISSLAFSEDGSVLVTGGADSAIRLYSTQVIPFVCLAQMIGHSRRITSLQIADTYLLSASEDRTLRKWDIPTSEQSFMKTVTKGPISHMTYAQGAEAIVCSELEDVLLFNFRTGDAMNTFKGHSLAVTCLAYVAPGWFDDDVEKQMNAGGPKRFTNKNFQKGIVISGSADSVVKSWSVTSDRLISTFKGHTGAVTCLDVDAAGKVLYTGSADKTIRSWKLITGQSLRTFHGHEGTITCLKSTRKMLFSGASDLSARAWATEIGDLVHELKGHEMSINSLCLLEGIVFTACGDKKVRAYSQRTGKLIRVFDGHSSSIISAVAIYDRLYTTDFNGRLRIWHTGEVFSYAKNKM